MQFLQFLSVQLSAKILDAVLAAALRSLCCYCCCQLGLRVGTGGCQLGLRLGTGGCLSAKNTLCVRRYRCSRRRGHIIHRAPHSLRRCCQMGL